MTNSLRFLVLALSGSSWTWCSQGSWSRRSLSSTHHWCVAICIFGYAALVAS